MTAPNPSQREAPPGLRLRPSYPIPQSKTRARRASRVPPGTRLALTPTADPWRRQWPLKLTPFYNVITPQSSLRGRQRSGGVAQNMKRRGRCDPRALARFRHRPRLMRFVPSRTVVFCQQQSVAQLAGRQRLEQRRAFVVEDDMATLSALAGSDMNSAAVRVEIRCSQRRQFAIARAAHKRRLRQPTEIRRRAGEAARSRSHF
jgi:hypothetical protein